MTTLELIEEALNYFQEKESEWDFRKQNSIFNDKNDLKSAIKCDILELQRLLELMEKENG